MSRRGRRLIDTVPQPEENGTDATPELKDATVTLPAGVTVDPVGGGWP